MTLLYTPEQIHQFAKLLSLKHPLDTVESAAKLLFNTTITLREERMSPGMCKYHIIGLNFDAVLHHFTEPDTGDPHDHPWGFTTHILRGSYVEEIYNLNSPVPIIRTRRTGTTHEVDADTIHRLVALPDSDCWTLILPKSGNGKVSGFYRPMDGWQKRLHDEKEWREVR